MELSKAEHIIIAACLIGLTIMMFEHYYQDKEWIKYLLFIPVGLLFWAKKVNKKEVQELIEEEKKSKKDE